MHHKLSLTNVHLTLEDGNTINAYRLVLATASNCLRDMFCEAFSEALGDASHNDPAVILVKDCTHSYLLSIISECYIYIDKNGHSTSPKDFVYTGVSPSYSDPNDII